MFFERCFKKVPIALVNALMVDTNLNSVQHLFGKLAGVNGSISLSTGLWEMCKQGTHSSSDKCFNG